MEVMRDLLKAAQGIGGSRCMLSLFFPTILTLALLSHTILIMLIIYNRNHEATSRQTAHAVLVSKRERVWADIQ